MEINTERLEKQLDFIKEIDRLKNVLRKTKLFDGSRVENDAEHSWHLAMMAIILIEYSNEKIDILKVLKMVLIHDIVEIDSGDVFLYDKINNHKNTLNEELAANRIFGILPEDQRNEFIMIWKEFEDRKTAEAKFARAVDRFEPILQNIANKGEVWNEHNITSELIIEKNKIIEEGSLTIWKKVKELIKGAVENGFIKSK